MTETIYFQDNWKSRSGHYLDHLDLLPFDYYWNDDDYFLSHVDNDNTLKDSNWNDSPLKEESFCSIKQEDVSPDVMNYDFQGYPPQELDGNPTAFTPAATTGTVFNSTPMYNSTVAQMNPFVAQQLAIGIQNYYYTRPQKKVIQDSEISPMVLSKLAMKTDKPFENIPREFNEETHKEIIRPKKRMKKSVELPDPQNFHNFSEYKDALNSLDSISFENYITEVKRHIMLTPSEKEEIKQIRSRIKNREAARKSRLKKKNRPKILEDTVRELLLENKNLEKDIADLNQEKMDIYNETAFLTNMITDRKSVV